MSIDERWFRRFGGDIDPIKTHADFRKWEKQRPHSDAQRYRKLLQLTSGLQRASIQHYLLGRLYKLSRETVIELDHLTEALGQKPPRGTQREPTWRPRQMRKVAIILPERDASSRYSWQLTSSIAQAARKRTIATAVYQSSGGSRQLAECVGRIARSFGPDALLIARLTPGKPALEQLTRYQIPTVLIHSNRLTPERLRGTPVMANIVTVHNDLAGQLRRWASSRKGAGQFLLVSMPREKGGRASIRNDRIHCVLKALEPHQVKHLEVDDYHFYQALDILPHIQSCRGVVALSDEIAGALVQVLTATRKYRSGMVVGFDNSSIADRLGFPSVDQQLSLVGRVVVEELAKLNDSVGPAFPEFSEISFAARLVTRTRQSTKGG